MTLACPREAIQTPSYRATIVPMLRTLLVLVSALAFACSAMAQAPASGKRVRRLLIHNAIVIDGNGTPASGPKDIVIENNAIADVIPLDAVAAARGSRAVTQADAIIDATGKYVLPGLINAHAHLQEERGGKPQPLEYELNIWLACGITAIRDVGSDTKRALCLRISSARLVSLPTSRMAVMPQASHMLSSYSSGCGLPPRSSCKWACALISPGRTYFPVASITASACTGARDPARAAATASSGMTSEIALFSTTMSLGPLAGVPLPSITMALWINRRRPAANACTGC